MAAFPSYKILVFSWNTESLTLCETMSDEEADYNRSGYFTGWRYSYEIPDFYPHFTKYILHSSPDIIVIGFQEDRHPGSYFHSHFLVTEMPKIGYNLVKRTKLMGIGVTSYKGAIKGDLFQRGIRISIYAKTDLVSLIEREEQEMRKIIGNDGQDSYVCSSYITRGKGAAVSYLILPGYGRIAFICCHLPHNSKSLIEQRIFKNNMLRQNHISYSNQCFNNIIENLVLFKYPKPSHVIYFGDFNYRINTIDHTAYDIALKINQNIPSVLQTIYKDYDELKEQMNRKNIYEFLEGIDNSGPIFIPTCKLKKQRNNESSEFPVDIWKLGKHNQRFPSWCDRILYTSYIDGRNQHLRCDYYGRFDFGKIMTKSDHAGIIGLFTLV
jgi:hypothetical protein